MLVFLVGVSIVAIIQYDQKAIVEEGIYLSYTHPDHSPSLEEIRNRTQGREKPGDSS